MSAISRNPVPLLIALLVAAPAVAQPPSAELVQSVAQGGLAVIAGSNSSELATRIAGQGRWLVLQLAADEGDRDALRDDINKAGLQGQVRVEVLSDRRVPLAKEMANAVIVFRDAIDVEESQRVLVPKRGVAWRQGTDSDNTAWTRQTKQMPANYGRWTHWAADAQGTRTSSETGMQVSNAVRWMAGPWYGDNINPNGWRLENGLAAVEWNLAGFKSRETFLNAEVRDAFNGIVQWRQTNSTGAESHKTRPVVLIDGVFLRPDDSSPGQPLAAFDAQTGEKLRTFTGMPTGDQRTNRPLNYGMIAAAGKIIQAGPDDDGKPLVRCMEIKTGKVLWSHAPTKNFVKPTLAGDLVVFVEEGEYRRPFTMWGGRYPAVMADALVALHADSGKLAWRTETNPDVADFTRVEPDVKSPKDWKEMWRKDRFHSIAYSDGRLFCLYACDANGGNPAVVWGVDAATGKSLWVSACGPEGNGRREMFDLYTLKDGSLMTYGHSWARLDAATGKLLGFGGIGGNGRCDTGSATADLITAGFGNYFKLEDGELQRTRRDLIRSECGGYTTPGYGITFGQSSGCGCFQPLRGLMAIHHTDLPKPIADEQRLARGSAYDQPLGEVAKIDQWPAYLANNARHTSVASAVPAEPIQAWSIKLADPLGPKTAGVKLDWRVACFNAGPVTAPVIADGLAVVAIRDEHTVVAVDAETGKERWRFVADGRLLNPPTLYKGRVIFGTRGGRVYNLDVQTGQLAWSFLAAPEHRYFVSYGQLESAWPLHGSLPVANDIIVASAGYHGETDGGVYVWGLDVQTGDIVWKRTIYRQPREWIDANANGSGDPEDDDWFNASQSNGRYNVTRVNNMELPSVVEGVAGVAMQWLDAKTGQPTNPPDAARIYHHQLYPYFNFRVEHRGGPHGSGAWLGLIDGRIIGDFRKGGEETKFAFADGRFYANYSMGRDQFEIMQLDPTKADPQKSKNPPTEIGTPVGVIPAAGVQALVVAGNQIITTGESETPSDFCLPVKGWLQVSKIGGSSHRIKLESATINSGIAIANGKIYATCQDGTLRCFAP